MFSLRSRGQEEVLGLYLHKIETEKKGKVEVFKHGLLNVTIFYITHKNIIYT